MSVKPSNILIFLFAIFLQVGCSTKPNYSFQQIVNLNSDSERTKIQSFSEKNKCNEENTFEDEIVSKESDCFRNALDIQEDYPSCDEKKHPNTWDKCIGNLRNSKFSGYEVKGIFDKGELYKGYFSAVLPPDYSSFYFYSGEWKNSLPHGIGIMKFADGNFVRGTWNKGILEKTYIKTYQKSSLA